MKTIIKVLLLIGLLSFSASMTLAQSNSQEVFFAKVYSTLGLDTAVHSIDLLSEGLSFPDFTENELTIKPVYSTKPVGRFTITAAITKNNAVIESKQIRLFIHKFAEVLIVNDRVSRFQEIAESAVSLERREITDLRELPLTSIEPLAGQRAKRNLMKGTILTTGDIEPLPAIMAHRDINLIYVSGLCRVTSQGESLQDGKVGDFIKVKNKSSGKIVIARVIDETAASVGP